MTYAAAFSPDYIASRARFTASALALGCDVDAVAVDGRGPEDEPLSIEVARVGERSAPRVLVISSGLHGIDGYVGAAVQARLLEDELGGWSPPPGIALVFVHALEPAGYAWTRRADAENIVLERNLLLPGQDFIGCSESFHRLAALLHPSTPRSLDLFRLRAGVALARMGSAALVEVVDGGQHSSPHGLAFAGAGPSAAHRALACALPSWLAGARQVLHLDIGTGLGTWGAAELLAARGADSPRLERLRRLLGPQVQGWRGSEAELAARGGLGVWCAARFPEVDYDVVTVRFGARGLLELVAAMRAENRAHQYADITDPVWSASKARLRDAFVPRDPLWRERVVKRGVDIVLAALEAVIGGSW